jgi:hypothetical protein
LPHLFLGESIVKRAAEDVSVASLNHERRLEAFVKVERWSEPDGLIRCLVEISFVSHYIEASLDRRPSSVIYRVFLAALNASWTLDAILFRRLQFQEIKERIPILGFLGANLPSHGKAVLETKNR